MTRNDITLVRCYPYTGVNANAIYLIRPVVIEQCALKTDLALFDAGDQTEVGEKGITLRYVHSHIFNTEFHLPLTPSVVVKR